jgi:hypothetical protein
MWLCMGLTTGAPPPTARSPTRGRPRSSLGIGGGGGMGSAIGEIVGSRRAVLNPRPRSAATNPTAATNRSAITSDAADAAVRTVYAVHSVHSIPHVPTIALLDDDARALRASQSLPLLPTIPRVATPPYYRPLSPSPSPSAASFSRSPTRSLSRSPSPSGSISPSRKQPPPSDKASAIPPPTAPAALPLEPDSNPSHMQSPLVITGVGRVPPPPACSPATTAELPWSPTSSPVQHHWRVSTPQPGATRGLFLVGRNAQLLHAMHHREHEPHVRTLAEVRHTRA